MWYHMFGAWHPVWHLHLIQPGSNAARAGSNAAPGRFKCNPIWIKFRPCSSSTYVCLSWHQYQVAGVYYSISGISPNALAPSPPPPLSRSGLSITLIDFFATLLLTRGCLSDFGANLYHSTSLHLIYPVLRVVHLLQDPDNRWILIFIK